MFIVTEYAALIVNNCIILGCYKLTSLAYRVQTYLVRRSLECSSIKDMSTKFSGWGGGGVCKQNLFSLKSSFEPDRVWCSWVVSSEFHENRSKRNTIVKFGKRLYVHTILSEKRPGHT